MTYLVCPERVRDYQTREDLNVLVAQMYPGQTVSYTRAQRAIQQHRCPQFRPLGMMIEPIVDAEGNLQPDYNFRLGDNLALCAEHGTIADRFPSRSVHEQAVLGRLLDTWHCQHCGIPFPTAEFITHMNGRAQCRNYTIEVLQGELQHMPPGINWDEARAAETRQRNLAVLDEPFFDEDDGDPENFVDDDDDDDGLGGAIDHEPVLNAIFLDPVPRPLNVEGATITNHFDDTIHAPVTMGDGRYLRWNTLAGQYEEARRPATTLHDALEAPQ